MAFRCFSSTPRNISDCSSTSILAMFCKFIALTVTTIRTRTINSSSHQPLLQKAQVQSRLAAVTEATSRVRVYITHDKKGLLEDHLEMLEKVRARAVENVSEQEMIKRKIFKMKEDLAQSSTVQRNLKDNINYRLVFSFDPRYFPQKSVGRTSAH